jgi:NAD(P)-dependent dehydrogenase (short-subunit alcohol dehydrogenase family)
MPHNKKLQRMFEDLKNKVAFITGAAHGQGRAAALALAKEGVHIAAFDIARQLSYPAYTLGSEDELQSLKKEVETLGAKALVFKGDVRVDADIVAAVEETKRAFNRIDILFNNAGICAYGYAHELTEEEWDTMLDINLKGAWLVSRRIIPLLIEQKSGVIINNSSVAGLRGMNRLSHYAASKWALTGLTKSWAIELAPYNIRVISIHPTGVNTPMNDGLAEMEGSTPIEIAERSAGNLLKAPWVESEDVANAVVFLASDKARFVTGSQFVLDAGLLTR